MIDSGRGPQKWLLSWLKYPQLVTLDLQLQFLMLLFSAAAAAAAAALLLRTHSGPAHTLLTTSQTLPVWDDDKETMGRQIYNTLIPYGILIKPADYI